MFSIQVAERRGRTLNQRQDSYPKQTFSIRVLGIAGSSFDISWGRLRADVQMFAAFHKVAGEVNGRVPSPDHPPAVSRMPISTEVSFHPVRSSAQDTLYEIPHWYACYTRARHEKAVHARLVRNGIESYLPLVERVHQWQDRKKRVSTVIFPGYVFGRFTLDALMQVLGTPGLATVVGLRGIPVPIPDAEILNVRHFSRALSTTGAEADDAADFPSGLRVRVTSGPFAGVEGIVTESRGVRRVRVGIELIGRFLDVDIGTGILEPAAAPR